jgi:hypothetical protein
LNRGRLLSALEIDAGIGEHLAQAGFCLGYAHDETVTRGTIDRAT